jgi:hypothetical protein
MNMLPIIYCVHCGAKAAPCLFLCAQCARDGQKLPNNYDPEHQFHCSFCGEGLKDWWDFDANGFLKSKDYLCIGCDFAEQRNRAIADDNVEYLPRAIEYIEECLRNPALPEHIRHNFIEHKKHFERRIKH